MWPVVSEVIEGARLAGPETSKSDEASASPGASVANWTGPSAPLPSASYSSAPVAES
jgi:hypothetical protein